MKRDTLFYRIFQEYPGLLFELTGNPPVNAVGYRFDSVAVKEPTFTIDGVFLPPEMDGTGTLYFCEVQMQRDPVLYERVFAEMFLYFYRSRQFYRDWQCVIIYPSRSTEQDRFHPYRVLLGSEQVQIIYLDELGNIRDLPLLTSLAVLTTLSPKNAPAEARNILARAQKHSQQSEVIIELVARIISYMFTNLSSQEVDRMLDIRFEDTRVYKDTYAKGHLDMVLKLLDRSCGSLKIELIRQVEALPLDRLEALGYALLDFDQVKDLEDWLKVPVAED
jgi:predicted transposase/invertase (TIGR01784 family)